jgi:DNA-binding transcriptional LysR family regulator
VKELDLRLLRSFVAVAEELHFTRAANRLYVAQQALSRDIRRLEEQVGAPLFFWSTRRVTLTPEGERLLVHARSLLAANDAALEELRGATRPILVDVVGEGTVAARIVDAARAAAPQFEFTMRYGGGMGAALPQVLAGRVDAAFGRPEALGRPFPAELTRRLIGFEPLALLIPETHALAELPEVPCGRLSAVEVDASVGNEDAPEWVDLAVALLDAFGGRPSAAHPHVVGTNETARHLEQHGLPILTRGERPPITGAVIRPLVDPVPLYAWSIVQRRDATHPALATLYAVATDVAGADGWGRLPDDGWLPSADRRLASQT